MQFLASRELMKRGNNISMISTYECSGKPLVAVLWMRRKRRHFVSSFHRTSKGAPACRKRCRTIDCENSKVQLDMSVPDGVE